MRIALVWLVMASLFFYAFWDVRYLSVLLTSVGVNFWLGGRILAARDRAQDLRAKHWMIIGVSFNLLVLGGFKYAYFLASNLFAMFDQAAPFASPVLPLAISFVTFQKIAYLVDCRRGLVTRHNPLDYLFFVSFFPQLIAGPIVHHRPLISQTHQDKNPLFSQPEIFIAGFSFFSIGLFKKVVLADSLARYATPIFELARQTIPSGEAAWQSMLAYTLQLYFDFSGYSDMAIGLALLFGFKLPVNFSSPYQATSVIEFWRRWHMTLSSFLRDYLYIPLGGNQQGALARYRNLTITMLLAGLWHGAGWNFLLWGALHGILLLLNHAWRNVVSRMAMLAAVAKRIPTVFATTMTFLLVAFAWVLFRSPDMLTASHMYRGLFHPLSGISLPHPQWQSAGAMLEGMTSASVEMGWLWIAIGVFVVMALPSSAKLLSYDPTPNSAYTIRPRFTLGLLAGVCFWLAMKWIAVRPATEFLYFNF